MKTLIICSAVLFACCDSPADSLRLEGEAFHLGAARIEWAVPAQSIPPTMWIYKVSPQPFSQAVISNAMALGELHPRDSTKPDFAPNDKYALNFIHVVSGQPCQLKVSPLLGWMALYNPSAAASMSDAIDGVPDDNQVESLAFEYLHRLGIDRTQIAGGPKKRTQIRRGTIDKSGTESNVEIQERGIMLIRQIDGISFRANASCGGLWIQFGNQSKVTQFVLEWRNLNPFKLCKALSKEQIIELIRQGRAVMPTPTDVNEITGIEIISATPYYFGETEGKPQDLTYPFVSLGITATSGGGKLAFELLCPVIDDSH